MSILRVENLSFSVGDRDILNHVSFRLLKGEHIALVGANGEGKSTFLSLVTNKLNPDEGKVDWAKNVKVGYLDQHAVLEKGKTIKDILKTAFDDLFKAEERMMECYEKMADENSNSDELMEEAGEIQDYLSVHGFYALDSQIEEVSRALGIYDLGLDKDVTALSGGQRTKILLAKLLLEKPDILLLDEPTNYLDSEHIAWLKEYLKEYENAFILISHDIPFLEGIINVVYHIENAELYRYPGDYHHFEEVYAMKKAQNEAAYERQQKEIAELKDFVARNKARVATRNMAMSRQKKLDKMELIEKRQEKPNAEFNFKNARTPGRVLFKTEDLVIGYEGALSRPIAFELERKEKVVFKGTNGIGKTTLLKSLLGLIKPINGSIEKDPYLEIGYFEQETVPSTNTCLEEVWKAFPILSQFEVRAALAKCGLTTNHIESRISVLSGGEQAKVRLCKLMQQNANLLVLDEPTNHLDVASKEALKQALIDYDGTILLVCHEDDFYKDFATRVVDCREWSARI